MASAAVWSIWWTSSKKPSFANSKWSKYVIYLHPFIKLCSYSHNCVNKLYLGLLKGIECFTTVFVFVVCRQVSLLHWACVFLPTCAFSFLLEPRFIITTLKEIPFCDTDLFCEVLCLLGVMPNPFNWGLWLMRYLKSQALNDWDCSLVFDGLVMDLLSIFLCFSWSCLS